MTPQRPPFQIMWNPGHNPEFGKPLAELKLPRGNWEFNALFRDCITALKWGLNDPRDFWAKPKDIQALMVATVEAEMEMQSWEEIDSSRRIK